MADEPHGGGGMAAGDTAADRSPAGDTAADRSPAGDTAGEEPAADAADDEAVGAGPGPSVRTKLVAGVVAIVVAGFAVASLAGGGGSKKSDDTAAVDGAGSDAAGSAAANNSAPPSKYKPAKGPVRHDDKIGTTHNKAIPSHHTHVADTPPRSCQAAATLSRIIPPPAVPTANSANRPQKTPPHTAMPLRRTNGWPRWHQTNALPPRQHKTTPTCWHIDKYKFCP